ncbi:hypothetical protein P3S67_001908 [Capsicum chacoense]
MSCCSELNFVNYGFLIISAILCIIFLVSSSLSSISSRIDSIIFTTKEVTDF